MRQNVTRVALVVLLLGGLLAACGGDNDKKTAKDNDGGPSDVPATRLDVTATEYAFAAPDTIAGGWVSLRLNNAGKEAHQAQLVRINDGVTPQQLQEAQAGDPTGEKVLGLVTVSGGVNGIAAGVESAAVTELNPGNYLMLCFLPAPDGKTHVEKGMAKPLTVTEPKAEADDPSFEETIVARDFTFDLPAISAGERRLRFNNQGPSPHEATLYKVSDGKTADDVQAFLGNPAAATGPPPFTAAGGAAAVAPNALTFPRLDLTPGNYVVTCFVPDPSTGKPHIQLGMFKAFEIK